MKAWMVFWTFLLVSSLIVYAGLVVCVAYGGLKDVFAMFRTIDEEHRQSKDLQDAEDPSHS